MRASAALRRHATRPSATTRCDSGSQPVRARDGLRCRGAGAAGVDPAGHGAPSAPARSARTEGWSISTQDVPCSPGNRTGLRRAHATATRGARAEAQPMSARGALRPSRARATDGTETSRCGCGAPCPHGGRPRRARGVFDRRASARPAGPRPAAAPRGGAQPMPIRDGARSPRKRATGPDDKAPLRRRAGARARDGLRRRATPYGRDDPLRSGTRLPRRGAASGFTGPARSAVEPPGHGAPDTAQAGATPRGRRPSSPCERRSAATPPGR
jgi:hypothetical protein